MSDTDVLNKLLACPRCDKAPLAQKDDGLHCSACKIDFPSIDGIPWMFAEPEASLGEWRGRMQLALQTLSHESARLDSELEDKNMRPLTRRRLERYKKATDYHRRSLQKLMQPLELQTLSGTLETYLALRTRLPSDQGLNTYYANVHRDWSWGDDENKASIKQIRAAAFTESSSTTDTTRDHFLRVEFSVEGQDYRVGDTFIVTVDDTTFSVPLPPVARALLTDKQLAKEIAEAIDADPRFNAVALPNSATIRITDAAVAPASQLPSAPVGDDPFILVVERESGVVRGVF
ncbi:MAG: hypothetical protein IIA12_01765, partial [Proteobacteria bacterium]|nr:hypothetical protein [Pseudomonadota bacterium]